MTDDLTITGAGARETIMDADGIDRVLHNVTEGTDLKVTGVTLTGGAVSFQSGPTNSKVDFLGGGIENNGNLDLRESAVRDNTVTHASTYDGTPYNYGEVAGIHSGAPDGVSASTASLKITDSTVSGNSATPGGSLGGVVLGGSGATGRIENSTISGNCCTGATVESGGDLDLLSSTVANNMVDNPGYTMVSNLGVFNGSTATVANSIIALDGGDGKDCDSTLGAGAIVSGGNNIDSDGSCGLDRPTDKPDTDPLLEALANNGGPTNTRALKSGSPAIDAGDDVACPDQDQRGVERPQDGDDEGTKTCDIGSFELEDPTPPPAPRCSDGEDNDSDGKTDFGDSPDNDPGCESETDDDETGTPTLSISDAQASEGSGEIAFTVTRSGDTGATSTVEFATEEGAATSPEDFAEQAGALTFDPDETEQTVTVTINGDTTDENDETFSVNLSGASSAAVDDGEGVGTIRDDDGSSSSRCTVKGTSKNENLTGTNGPDGICGLGGNDTISGLGGNDALIGESGHDRIEGGPGRDEIRGGRGNDTVKAADGEKDLVRCGTGRDTVVADPEDDVGRGCEKVTWSRPR